MIRTHLNRALLISAAMLLASGAAAQSTNSAPQAKAKTDTDKKGDVAKPDNKDGKDKSDREARKAKEHDAQKEKLRATLKAPMDDAMKQELRRHAERLARLDRIKVVALEAKDKDIADRAGKLADKENARHDKWVAGHASTNATTAAPVVPVAPAAKPETKGGAQ